MTPTEANIIAVLRIHFGCSFSKLAGLARSIWGETRCREISGGRHGYGSPLGQDLVVAMEDTLGLDRCESDNMVMAEQFCMKCNYSQWYLSYPADTPKECANCGEMGSVFTGGGGAAKP